MEHEIWLISVPFFTLIIFFYLAFKFDVETKELEGIVGKTFLKGSDCGDIQTLMIHLNDGIVAYISNKIRVPISKGNKIYLSQQKKLIGKLSYKLKATGSCVGN